ncbi:hypothetical protein BET10_16305 [Pseudoalteromonas amylolytica]|uniref:DUF4402 domain-containing protein n=2 Tax=Pseudoalteromonas TaxID=53246 RepID=A0A1S1MT53_9GAMM|nr:hypothetical protein BFC16_16015 [Pseudoalteromonas sp. JW3]OHU89686.1 hypothetical protein BET10_16305 [Pseudoalteromonas amylolytica]
MWLDNMDVSSMRKIISLIFLALIVTKNVSAREFGINVNFEAQSTPLEITERKSMEFPDLIADNATKNGAKCEVYGVVNSGTNETSLCPGQIGRMGEFKISGAPNGAVTVTHTADQTINGLRFSTNSSAQPVLKPLTLDLKGEATFFAGGVITLVDKSTAQTNAYQFFYDVSVAYQ